MVQGTTNRARSITSGYIFGGFDSLTLPLMKITVFNYPKKI
jgi:hypothetical protein